MEYTFESIVESSKQDVKYLNCKNIAALGMKIIYYQVKSTVLKPIDFKLT